MAEKYYDDGTCVIYHGDCRDVVDALDISRPAVVTDPPYGVGIKYGTFDDSRPDYWDWMRDTVEWMRSVATTLTFTHRVPALRELRGWDWVGVWNKPSNTSGLNSLPIMPHWEPIFLYGIVGRGTGDLPRHFDVVSVNAIKTNAEKAALLGHPCSKPVSLMAHLLQWCDPTDVVLDPFMGSGTTLRAAKDLGRRAVGVEIEEWYCEIAAKRLAQEVLAL